MNGMGQMEDDGNIRIIEFSQHGNERGICLWWNFVWIFPLKLKDFLHL